MSTIIDWIKTYWLVFITGAVVVGMLIFIANRSGDLVELEHDVDEVKALIADAEKTRDQIPTEFDYEAHQEQIEERTVSASKIGKEIIAVDDVLTAYYKTAEPLPESEKEKEALFKEVEEAQARNTELTGAGEADHIATWQLNPEWTLELESVVTYQDTDRVPVVFSMTTKEGKQAGLIFAIYDAPSFSLKNISRHYTPEGLRDQADVGGM